MTPEQKQRIEQIEKWQESRRGLVNSARRHADLDASHPEIRMHGYIDFLLSLVKSQEAPDCWPDMAAVNREYHYTVMRSACVEKVKAMRNENQRNYEYWKSISSNPDTDFGVLKWGAWKGEDERVITALESVSIQEQEK